MNASPLFKLPPSHQLTQNEYKFLEIFIFVAGEFGGFCFSATHTTWLFRSLHSIEYWPINILIYSSGPPTEKNNRERALAKNTAWASLDRMEQQILWILVNRKFKNLHFIRWMFLYLLLDEKNKYFISILFNWVPILLSKVEHRAGSKYLNSNTECPNRLKICFLSWQ